MKIQYTEEEARRILAQFSESQQAELLRLAEMFLESLAKSKEAKVSR